MEINDGLGRNVISGFADVTSAGKVVREDGEILTPMPAIIEGDWLRC
jgi:hypothetical protein